jgi:hypothetical protein
MNFHGAQTPNCFLHVVYLIRVSCSTLKAMHNTQTCIQGQLKERAVKTLKTFYELMTALTKYVWVPGDRRTWTRYAFRCFYFASSHLILPTHIPWA